MIRQLAQGLQRGADLSGFGGAWGPFSDGTIPPNSWSMSDPGGMPVTEDAVLHLIDAYACVTLIADSVALLPFDGFSRSDTTRKPLSPAPPIVDQPDPEVTRGEFMGRVAISMALRGNAYCPFTDIDRAGYPVSVTTVHPDDVRVVRSQKTNQVEYELRSGRTLPARSMIHIRLNSLPGADVGLSPIECARRGIRMSINTETFGDRWFTDGANPSSVMETDQNLDDKQSREMQARWIASHGGRRRPAVLSGGVKWRPITLTPNESQFLETRALNTMGTARIWRVPPHMIGQVDKTSSWGKGIEEQGIGFTVYTLGNYLARIEAAFSTKQVSPRAQYAKFKVAALLRGNTQERFAAYAVARQWGWMSVNDIRELEDLPPLTEGGDTYLQPLNMVDAEAALAALKLQAAGDTGNVLEDEAP